ncbi:hypothetical protein ROSMUCSMR3_00275 [Roseovarius mucosus]|uniref:Uncharacterized protein n=1 Tax=Roseovarius mucosus TaxID=215743 RepID=A0A1V0RJ27_9RHOB|nr:hypothetical protein ROSMUCSMR3_00275 [Roseovarius mucosus]
MGKVYWQAFEALGIGFFMSSGRGGGLEKSTSKKRCYYWTYY